MTTHPPTDRSGVALDQAVTTISAELGRTDQKAALLLGLDGALVAALAAIATELPAPARATAAIAGAALIASVLLLLLAVRPRLGGTDRASFPYWASLTPGQITTALRADRRPQQIAALSKIAVRKFGRVQQAVDLTIAAVLLLAAAATIAVLS